MGRGLAVLLGVLAFLSPGRAEGQRAFSAFPAAPALQGGVGRAYVIEAAGGIAGSLLGFAVIYQRAENCDVEDLGCIIEAAGIGMLTSTVGAAAGTILAGRAGHTSPLALGAVLGAVAGAAAGIGVWHFWTEELSLGNSRLAGMLSYSITQGAVTAAGSRIVRALK